MKVPNSEGGVKQYALDLKPGTVFEDLEGDYMLRVARELCVRLEDGEVFDAGAVNVQRTCPDARLEV